MQLKYIANPYREHRSISIFYFVGHIETCAYNMVDFIQMCICFDLVIVINGFNYSPSNVIPQQISNTSCSV